MPCAQKEKGGGARSFRHHLAKCKVMEEDWPSLKKERNLSFAVPEEDVPKDPPVEYFCGIGSFRPKCLQIFRSANFFTFLLCCFTFIEGALATGEYTTLRVCSLRVYAPA